nr:AsmA-like C-terminal region-containing protein [Roseomonas acroporae]
MGHRLLRRVCALALLLALALGGLAWRLAEGPLAVPFLPGALERAAAREGVRLEVGLATVGWAGWHAGLGAPLELRLGRVRALDPAGVVRADLPEAAITLSFRRLLHGELALHGLTLRHPVLRLARAADGAVSAGLGESAAEAPGEAELPVVSSVLATLLGPARDDGLLAGLRRVRLENGLLTVADRALHLDWSLRGISVAVDRPAQGGLAGTGAATLAVGTERVPVRLSARAEALPVLRAADPAPAAAQGSGQGNGQGDGRGNAPGGDPGAAPDVASDVAPGGGTARDAAPAPLATSRAPIPPARLRLEAELPVVRPAALSRQAPGLARLAAFDAPARLTASLELDEALRPKRLRAGLHAGPGVVDLGPGRRVPFDLLEAEAEGGPDTVIVPRLTLRLPARPAPAAASSGPAGRAARPAPGATAPGSANPGSSTGPTLVATLAARRQPDRWRGRATLTLDQVRLADLPGYWPPRLGGHEREWITENLTAGIARNGSWQAEGEVSAAFDRASLAAASGTLEVAGATVHWLRPIPPMENVAGTVEFSPTEVTVRARAGRQSGTALDLRDATLRFFALDTEPGQAEMQLGLGGPLADVLTVIRQPRLHLFDRRPLELRATGGTAEARLGIAFPLYADLPAEMLRLSATAKLADARLPGAAIGRDIERGQFDLAVDTERLRASGPALVSGVPSQLSVEMDFRPGPATQVVERIGYSGRPTIAQLVPFNLDLTDYAEGPVALEARTERRRNGTMQAVVRGDLRDTRLMLEPLAWSGPAGRPGTAEAVLRLRGDVLQSVDNIRVDAGDLSLRGSATLRARSRLDRIVLREGAAGANRFAGEIVAPEREGGEWRIAAQGAVLDLGPVLAREATAGAAPEDGSGGAPLALDGRFERVLLGEGRQVQGVVARVRAEGSGVLREAAVTGRTSPRGGFEFMVAPQPGGRRDLRLVSESGGELLRALDLLDSIEGGRLTVTGSYADSRRGAALHGNATMTDFSVGGAPAAAKLLQALTVYGLVDVARSPGLAFSQMHAPFVLTPGLLTIGEARAFSSSLGLTAQGTLDRQRHRLDLRGTIVPAYVLNSALGRLPVIGRLFSPEAGGGLFSVSYSVRGPLADPQVSVNPLTAVTPGFLRNLFGRQAQGGR